MKNPRFLSLSIMGPGDSRAPRTARLMIQTAEEGNSRSETLSVIDLDEHQFVQLLTGMTLRVEDRVSR